MSISSRSASNPHLQNTGIVCEGGLQGDTVNLVCPYKARNKENKNQWKRERSMEYYLLCGHGGVCFVEWNAEENVNMDCAKFDWINVQRVT